MKSQSYCQDQNIHCLLHKATIKIFKSNLGTLAELSTLQIGTANIHISLYFTFLLQGLIIFFFSSNIEITFLGIRLKIPADA